MKHTFIINYFEIELSVDGESLNDYYDVDLEVVADVDFEPGRIPSLMNPGSPSICTIDILSYKVIKAADGNAADLDKRLHEDPSSLDLLYDLVWEEFTLMQEDGDGEDGED